MTTIYAEIRGRTVQIELPDVAEGEDGDLWVRLFKWDSEHGTDMADLISMNSNGIRLTPAGGKVDDVVSDQESFTAYVEAMARDGAAPFLGFLDRGGSDLIGSMALTAIEEGENMVYHGPDEVDTENGIRPYVTCSSMGLSWTFELLRGLRDPSDRREIRAWACGFGMQPEARCRRRTDLATAQPGRRPRDRGR